jgi:hypothetical protein
MEYWMSISIKGRNPNEIDQLNDADNTKLKNSFFKRID